MKNIGIIVDSSTILTPNLKESPNVHLVPLEVIVEGQSYKDGIELTPEKWVEFLSEDKAMSTSQPTLAQTLSVFQEVAAKNYDHVFVLSLAGTLSGTLNNFMMAKGQLDYENFEVIDTQTVGGAVSAMVQEIQYGIEKDASLDEIRRRIRTIINHNDTFVKAGSLERLIKSGRVNNTIGKVASLLKLNILLSFRNKESSISKEDIFRTHKKLVNRLVDLAKEKQPNLIYILDCEAPKEVQDLKEKLEEALGPVPIVLDSVPGVLATHVGLGTIGIQLIRRESR